MKRFVRPSSPTSSSSLRARFESLEDRRHLSASPLGSDAAQLVFSDIVGGTATPSRFVKISNTSSAPVTIPLNGLSIGGAAASQFSLTNAPTGELVLEPGAS